MPPIDHLGTDQLLVNLTVKPDKHMIRTHFFNAYDKGPYTSYVDRILAFLTPSLIRVDKQRHFANPPPVCIDSYWKLFALYL